VLANFRKHARKRQPHGIDRFSSGESFDGFRDWRPGRGRTPWALRAPPPFTGSEATVARTWVVRPPKSDLARVSWRRFGLIRLDEAPATVAGVAEMVGALEARLAG
jgi:hypothetical protein